MWATYKLYLYFSKVEEVVTSIVGDERTLSFTKHCVNTLKAKMMTLPEYMETMKKGLPGIGRVFPGGHYDGMHHTLHVSAAMMEEIGVCLQTIYTPTLTDEYNLGFLRLEGARSAPVKKKEIPPSIKPIMKPERRERRISDGSLASSNVSEMSTPTRPSYKITPGLLEWKRIMATKEQPKAKIVSVCSVTDIEEDDRKEISPKVEEKSEVIVEEQEKPKFEEVPSEEEKEPVVNTNTPEVNRLIEIFYFPCGHTTTKLFRGWRRNLCCPECGREFTLGAEEAEKTPVLLKTTTTVVHTFEEK